MSGERFRDRRDAGRRLADLLTHYAREDPLVVALPRGGVPVGYEIARALRVPLEVLVVRKLGTPGRPELAMGAIGPGGVRVLNRDVVESLDIPDEAIQRVERAERRELEARVQRFQGDDRFPDVRGRTVILVDNGIATGSTVRAALRLLRQMDVGRLVLAAAVLPQETARELEPLVDDLVYLRAPEDFGAVGMWYEDFGQTSSGEVVELLQRAGRAPRDGTRVRHDEVTIPIDHTVLHGLLDVPADARGLVLFAHGSGSSRFSRRNQAVAAALREHGLGTLLFDLLSEAEEQRDRTTGELRFDIPLLADRLRRAAEWTRRQQTLRELPLGYFGASTGGGAALMADAARPGLVSAIVSRGGRPDLAGEALPDSVAPTLLIVGGNDTSVVRMNRDAQTRMRRGTRLEVVPGATHLFEEPGTLNEVARHAADWFLRHLTRNAVRAR